jgi:hypothetical protein
MNLMNNKLAPVANEKEELLFLLHAVELLSTHQTSEIRTFCTDYIVANLTPQTALRVLLECHNARLDELKGFILDTLELWTSFSLRTYLFSHPLFSNVSQVLLIDILKRKFQMKEMDLFVHLVRWALRQNNITLEQSTQMTLRICDKIPMRASLQEIFPFVK